MINTQRIIIMFIVLNMVVALSMNVHKESNYTLYDADMMNNQTMHIQNDMQDNNLFTTNPDTTMQIQDSSLILNVFKLIGGVGVFFKNALNPLSIPPWGFTNTIEKTIASILSIVRTFLLCIILIEAWSFFIHKKQP